MPIELNHCVIHELIKAPGSAVVNTDVKETCLDTENEHVIQLVTSLSDLIGRKDNQAARGTFDQRTTVYRVPPAFHTYFQSEKQVDNFHAFSVVCMNELAREVRGGNRIAATGGAIVFAEYTSQGLNYFLVAMIKQKDALQLNENLEPTGVVEIDLSKIHQAARVNYQKYESHMTLLANREGAAADGGDQEENNEEFLEILPNYLAFVSPRANADASGYFVVALGCTDSVPTAVATSKTLEGVKTYFSSPDLLPFQGDAYVRACQYLEDRLEQRQPARLTEIEHALRQAVPPELGDRLDGIVDHLNGENFGVPLEFGVNSRALKRNTRTKTATPEWELNFLTRLLGEEAGSQIRYVRAERRLIISDLPDDVRRKIEDALRP